jgi:hypothetical protein
VIALGGLAIAISGILIIVGARKIGCRVLLVGLVLVVAASALKPSQTSMPERSHVADR